jgi:hypothetical protein
MNLQIYRANAEIQVAVGIFDVRLLQVAGACGKDFLYVPQIAQINADIFFYLRLSAQSAGKI